jgi:GNAT superfamily N-acetyltransferase
MAEVRPIRAQEIPEVAALLGNVFGSDAMLTWTSPAEVDEAASAERFFASYHRAALDEGWIWVIGEEPIDGVVMWVPPDPDGRYGLVMDRIDPDVAEIVGERKPRYDEFWAWIDEHRPTRPHWYLEHVAVDADRRGAGLGRALIEHGLRRADADGAPAWLVTSKLTNVPLYERFGFEVRSAEDAPGSGPHLWFMVREPR